MWNNRTVPVDKLNSGRGNYHEDNFGRSRGSSVYLALVKHFQTDHNSSNAWCSDDNTQYLNNITDN